MTGALDLGGGLPPMPQQDGTQGLQAPGSPQTGPAMAPAPPTHAQTIAALRHFEAVKDSLVTVLRDPAVGKSDVKSQIIDGVTRLVAERMLTPSQAVVQLSQVPSDPLQQRKWLQTQLAQTVTAENVVLDHYGHGNPSLHDVESHVSTMDHGKIDDHLNHMAALHANYSSKGGQ